MTTKPPRLILGVDPGLTGAIALLDPTTEPPTLLSIFDMPIEEVRGHRIVDPYRLGTLIDGHAKDVRLAVVEDVGAMTYTQRRQDGSLEVRGQGAASSFNFGKATGVVHGVLAACMVPILLVKPAVWKCAMGLSSSKDLSRERAKKAFPAFEKLFQRKMDDGRAEAALLAMFARRYLK